MGTDRQLSGTLSVIFGRDSANWREITVMLPYYWNWNADEPEGWVQIAENVEGKMFLFETMGIGEPFEIVCSDAVPTSGDGRLVMKHHCRLMYLVATKSRIYARLNITPSANDDKSIEGRNIRALP